VKYWFNSTRQSAPYVPALTGLLAYAACSLSFAADSTNTLKENFRDIPTPPAFHIEATLLDGPVFANAKGKTLYKWSQHRLRNGYSGEAPGTPECYDDVLTVTAGLMSPYPAGIKLPELDSRVSCTDLWPPVLANNDAEAIGEWTIVERKDGSKQWAFDEQPLYTSVRDSRPGDVLGGTTRRFGGDSPAKRTPIGPPTLLPPGFAVRSTFIGRLLATDKNSSVYSFDQDSANAAACVEDCLSKWQPVIAPGLARPQGEWSVLERSPGVKQWVFRGKPLYTYSLDQSAWSLRGTDIPGWENVFTQVAPPLPSSFTSQATIQGNVLADANGSTMYVYNCGEDSADQLSCDHPETTQVYRLAMCGGGDPEKCLSYWPYVEALVSETAPNESLWTIVSIDPKTGRFASASQTDALRVWAYRDRPVFLYGQDKQPGDVNGAGTGEWRGQRNGLRAIWLRDDYMSGIL
jgi:predicted lipoprotein with Yx(FWY)xxD motif